MFRKHTTPDPSTPAKLALKYVDDNLAFTANEAWAWFILPTQPWAFRSDTQREQLLYGAGDGLAWLAGHRIHLRVTSKPYPTAEWAKRLDENTPGPTQGPGHTWHEHLVDMQKHLRTQTMAEKVVFLGVRLTARSPSHKLISALWRKPSNIEHARLLSKVERATETVSLPGLEGRPATAKEMEWLMRRSLGIGLPTPTDLSPISDGAWDTEDLHSFADRVDYAASPFAKTVQLAGRQGTNEIGRAHV